MFGYTHVPDKIYYKCLVLQNSNAIDKLCVYNNQQSKIDILGKLDLETIKDIFMLHISS